MVPRQSNELEFRVWRPVILFFAQLSGPRMSNVKRTIKYMLETPLLGILSWLPLKLRMQLAISLGRRNRLLGRSWLASLCVNDLRITRPNDFHKFLWNNHLFYAATYEIEQRFGAEKQKEPRRIFFSHLLDHLRKLDVAPERIQSVFEVGCSMGYQLRQLETEVFTYANRIGGLDIDEYAIKHGKMHLESLGSKVALIYGDMEKLDDLLDFNEYDIIICTGVLMYLSQENALAVVNSMLKRTKILLGLAGMAHPTRPNSEMTRSCIRNKDQAFYHDFENMIRKSGGNVIGESWEGDETASGSGIYFVFATPGL